MQDPTEVLDEYGADALRLYLINSPVVRGETLRFKKEGVFAVVKDVFLPWYNAYRFLVQNVLRLQQQTGIAFEPTKVWLQVMPSEDADMHPHVRVGASMQVFVVKCDAAHEKAHSLGVLLFDAVQNIKSSCLCCQLSSFVFTVCILSFVGILLRLFVHPVCFSPTSFLGCS